MLRKATLALVVLTWLVVLTGCSGGSSSSGGSAAVASAVVAVNPVHLAPGQTAAQLAWPASAGSVDSYLVFESRNGSPYAFSTVSATPSVNIAGTGGDSVQITVVAVSTTGQTSESSPPSPPTIFHDAPAAAVARVAAPSAGAPTAVAAVNADEADALSVSDNASDNAFADTANAADDDSTVSRIAQAIRALLLGGDARLPEAGLSAEADRWLQTQVDHELSAGVALAGTGRADDDDLRELIWRDNAGQLFVSNGQSALDTDDLPATFIEAVRLRATERFVGLADFDGDGHGDWLLEDMSTGDVWAVDGETSETISTETAFDTKLAGHGDFDGDGRAELIWATADGRLDIIGIEGELVASITASDGFELLAIADLDGNGRDDLLGHNLDGVLVMALATGTDAELRIDWHLGCADSTAELDLIGTVDVDKDGTAEIAWLNGEALEIWSAEAGLESRWTL